jgi:hypothetical protein
LLGHTYHEYVYNAVSPAKVPPSGSLLWRYETRSHDPQGLIFSDHTQEGIWAWLQAQLEGNPPYLIDYYGQIQPCTSEADFLRLCGSSGDTDPMVSYVVSGLVNPKALRREWESYGCGNGLHRLVRLGECAGWAYGWVWGGGDGEYHAYFWAKDPGLTRLLCEEIEALSATNRYVGVLGKF